MLDRKLSYLPNGDYIDMRSVKSIKVGTDRVMIKTDDDTHVILCEDQAKAQEIADDLAHRVNVLHMNQND